MIARLRKNDMARIKREQNGIFRICQQEMYWTDIPVNPERIIKLKIEDIENMEDAEVAKNDTYIKTNVIPKENYEDVGLIKGKMYSLHFPKASFNISLLHYPKRTYNHILKEYDHNQKYSMDFHFVRETKKKIKVIYAKVFIDEDIFT